MSTHSPVGVPCRVCSCYPCRCFYPTPAPAQTPHRCPVCAGRCTVAPDFYDQVRGGTSANRQPCRACISGVIWR